MKRLIYLVGITLSLTIMYSSCSKNDEEGIEKVDEIVNEKENEEVKEEAKDDENKEIDKQLSIKIAGTWSYYSGDLTTGILISPENYVYSQELSFISNGNLSEVVYTDFADEKQYGNWKIENKKIILNNWNGEYLKDSATINDLSETELSITYQNKKMIYKRLEWLYDSLNFCNEILGFWKTMEIKFPRYTYTFESDGTVGCHDYVWENLGGYGVFPWSYNPKSRELTTAQPRGGSEIATSKVEYINKYYLRWIQTFTRE